MKKQITTSKVGHKEPDRYPLGKFSKRLANRAARKKERVIKDVDTGWVDLPSGGRMRLRFKQVEW